LTPDEAKERAGQAKYLLDHPLLKETFANAEIALNQAVRTAKTPEEAFKAAIACQVFELLRGQIQAHIETGKIIEYNFKPTLRERIGL
jgi:hypothetical protein